MIWKNRARRLHLHRILQSLRLVKIAAHQHDIIVAHHQSVKQMKEIQKFRSAGGKNVCQQQEGEAMMGSTYRLHVQGVQLRNHTSTPTLAQMSSNHVWTGIRISQPLRQQV